MNDLHLAIDVAIGWVLARAAWACVTELIIKPLLVRLYRQVDHALADNLPDLP